MGRWRKFTSRSMPEPYEPVLCLGKNGSPFVGFMPLNSYVENNHVFMNLNGIQNGKMAFMWQRITYPDWDEFEKLTGKKVLPKYRNQKWGYED